MTITWLGHSCFLLESGGFRVLLDPYCNVPGLPDFAGETDAFYCSHGHFDHCYTEQLRVTDGRENPFAVSEIETFHDSQGGALRGKNTVRRFAAEGVSVVHLGDLGHQLSPAQLAAIGPCDVLLLPIGGAYTVDPAGAKAVADAVAPRVVVPMHYRDGARGFDVLDELAAFTALCPPELVVRYPGPTLAVTPDMPRQVAVLSLAL